MSSESPLPKPVLTVRSVRISARPRMGQDGHVSAVSQTSERVVAILEAACRVVVREGAHGLRMAAVAREAGVSKALVHYYFATRQELVRSAFSWSEEQWQSALRERIRSAPDAAARIEQALLLTLDPAEPFAEHRALWNEVWSSLRFDDELRPLVDSSYRKWIQRLTILVRGASGCARCCSTASGASSARDRRPRPRRRPRRADCRARSRGRRGRRDRARGARPSRRPGRAAPARRRQAGAARWRGGRHRSYVL